MGKWDKKKELQQPSLSEDGIATEVEVFCCHCGTKITGPGYTCCAAASFESRPVVADGTAEGIATDHERAVKGGYPDAHIRKTSDKHWAVFAEGKRLGGYSLLQETAWCYARVDPLFPPARPVEPAAPVVQPDAHDWVFNALSDSGMRVCRNCGLVEEAFHGPTDKGCKPHETFTGIPGFPPTNKASQPAPVVVRPEEMKPCPFCGKMPRSGEQRGTDESGEFYGYSYIECSHKQGDVFVGVHADSPEECLEAWNRRARPVEPAAPVQPARLLDVLRDKSGDWTEDFTHENGNYQNMCCECNRIFAGHKRRIACKGCVAKKASQPAPVVVGPDAEQYLMPRDQEPMWVLMFDDHERGHATYKSEAEGRAAFRAASQSWNCTLLAPVPKLTAQPAPLPSDQLELILLNARSEYQAQRDMWMGKECPSMADSCAYRMKEIEDYMRSVALPSDQKETFEEWIEHQWPEEEERAFETHLHGSKMRMAWDAAKGGTN